MERLKSALNNHASHMVTNQSYQPTKVGDFMKRDKVFIPSAGNTLRLLQVVGSIENTVTE
jgi:hypothetical protein